MQKKFWLGSSGVAGAFIPDRFHLKKIYQKSFRKILRTRLVI